MKIKNVDILNLKAGFDILSDVTVLPKLAYAMAKTRRALEPHLEAIEAAAKGVPEYDFARVKVLEMFCEKENGKPLIKDGSYVIPDEKQRDVEREIAALQERYSTTPADMRLRDAQINDLLREEVEVAIHQVRLEDLPSEKITPRIMSLLFCFVMQE